MRLETLLMILGTAFFLNAFPYDAHRLGVLHQDK